LASGELVLVEEFLLDNSVARELGVEEGVVVGGHVEVVVFSRDSAHRKNTNLMNTVSLCQIYQPLIGVSLLGRSISSLSLKRHFMLLYLYRVKDKFRAKPTLE
jgi:hypothetical protein